MHPHVRRTVWVAGLIGLVSASVFAVLLMLYQPAGTFQVSGSPAVPAQVDVHLDVLDVDPNEYTARLRLRIDGVERALLNADDRLAQPLRIAVTSSDGTDDITFPAGSALGRAEVAIGLSGEVSYYPFDVHTSDVVINAAIPGPDPGSLTETYLTSDVTITGGTPGWHTDATVVGQGRDETAVGLRFERSTTVLIVTFLVLGIAVVLAASALIIGFSVRFGHQPVESSILGWAAGLFFALLALRFYLPGDPPVGSAVDVFGYLWVIVGAFLGLCLMVWAWLRRPTSAA